MGRRQYHLGLDWGTSATKLVLRDYEQAKAFVLYLDDNLGTYRYSSTIALYRGRLYFGSKAEGYRLKSKTVYDALKGKIFSIANTESFSEEEDFATLYLAHIISKAFDCAEGHAARGNAQAVMGMTLGIPAEELDNKTLRQLYVRIARTAYEIAMRIGVDPQGERLCNCRQVLVLARELLSAKPLKDPFAHAQWLRPEMAAAMFWGVKSPVIESGLYSCVDIGAWTTNASYFRLNRHPEGNRISFYGGSCRQPGMIELLKTVADEKGIAYTELFGQERMLSLKQYSSHVQRLCYEYMTVWKKGFQVSYPMEQSQGAWDGKLQLMMVGGGSKVKGIRDTFESSFPSNCKWSPPKKVPELGVPQDLFEFPVDGILARKQFQGDCTFLLVAYGLSVHSKDFPETRLSQQVEPFKPIPRMKSSKSFDELGYDK